MSNYRSVYSPNRTCRSEMEISNLFERHAKALLEEKQRMIHEIVEWEKNVVRQIEENANEQKQRLEIEWKNQLEYLRIKRQEFLDTALIYEERRDREEVRQLLEQCHALKCQLGILEYPEQTIPFIRIEQENKPTSNIHDNPEKSTRNERRLERISIFTTDDRSSTTTVIDDDDMVEKCPACLMIFPSAMTSDERSRHVNQHFGDS